MFIYRVICLCFVLKMCGIGVVEVLILSIVGWVGFV